MTSKGASHPLTLWCGLGGLFYYPRPDQADDLARFLDRCAAAGVGTVRFYFSFVHQDLAVFRLERSPTGVATFDLYADDDPFQRLVSGSHARGIRVVGYTSPNYQGGAQPNPHSPLGEKLPLLFVSHFAHHHPDYWARDRQGRDGIEREGYMLINLALPEAQEYLAKSLTRLASDKNLDELELEWLCGKGTASPYQPEGQAGVQGVTQFVRQVRGRLEPKVELSAAAPADAKQALDWRYDWPGWVRQGLIDSLVLRHLGNDPTRIAATVSQARAVCSDRVRLITQLDCWNQAGLRDSRALISAAQAALEAGADQIGIYRADAVEALNLWPTIREISRMEPG